MTLSKIDFAKYPPELRARTVDPSITYVLQTDRYALHHSVPGGAVSGNAELVLSKDNRPIEILDGTLPDPTTKGSIGPVYASRPGGALAVPTGQVFVRFKSGVNAAGKTGDVERAGYKIAKLIDYAPEAAWLSDRSDDMAAALTKIHALEKIPDVENVEPQMLMPRVSK